LEKRERDKILGKEITIERVADKPTARRELMIDQQENNSHGEWANNQSVWQKQRKKLRRSSQQSSPTETKAKERWLALLGKKNNSQGERADKQSVYDKKRKKPRRGQ